MSNLSTCPQCGLQLFQRALRVEYCPRCLALRRTAVALIHGVDDDVGDRPAGTGPQSEMRLGLATGAAPRSAVARGL